MLYEIDLDAEPSAALEPVGFDDMAKVEKREKDLEEIIADNLVDVLFEEARLLPIYQERRGQGVADLYAVDRDGNLVIFELKTGTAEKHALRQIFRYSQQAGNWRYTRLSKMYGEYTGAKDKSSESVDLRVAHREAHDLEAPLPPHEFNRQQFLRIVGNAADNELIDAVDYWKQQGVKVDFIPYRLYELDGKRYFEFFSFPYDQHRNPAERKGVLFDTNKSWDDEAVWTMIEEARVAAWGDAKRFIDHLERGDMVFFHHKGKGVIAAGEVTSERKETEREGHGTEWYRDVEFQTPVPTRDQGIKRYLKPSEVSDITGKGFYWARAVKVPYLDRDEAIELLGELQIRLKGD